MTGTAVETMRERFARVTSELIDTDPRLAVVLAEIGKDGFAGAEHRHPDRLINVGIREQLMISVASGLALAGMRPIAHSYTPFLVERPFEQVKLDLAHQGVGAILVSVGASYDASNSGRTHQAPEDVALLSNLPDWTIHERWHGVYPKAPGMVQFVAEPEPEVHISIASGGCGMTMSFGLADEQWTAWQGPVESIGPAKPSMRPAAAVSEDS